MRSTKFNLYSICKTYWGWFVSLILIFGSIYLFFEILYADKPITNDSGEFGDLIAGTVGVAASISATLLILISLNEQRKMSRQNEIHHLVETFNSRFDRFIIMLRDDSEVEEKKNLKAHLLAAWFDSVNDESGKGILYTISRFNNRIREKNSELLSTLINSCKDEDLIKLGLGLSRILSIKNKILELDSEAGKRVDDDWHSISPIWKTMAGFYFAWNLHSLDKAVPKRTGHLDELVTIYTNGGKNKLPEEIPRISIVKMEEIKNWNLIEFECQTLSVVTKNTQKSTIVNWKFSSNEKTFFQHIIKINCELLHDNENKLTFRNLFGEKVEAAFNYLNETFFESESENFLYQEIVILYEGEEWTYENKIEIHKYPNNHASVIFTEIEENV